MKDLFKLLVIVGLVVSALFGCYYLAFKRDTHMPPPEERLYVTDRLHTQINTQVHNILSQGWQDSIYDNFAAMLAIYDNQLTQNDIKTLEDHFGTTAIATIDTLLTHTGGLFKPDLPISPINSIPSLDRAYKGVAFLGNKYAAVKNAPIYSRLQKDKDAYNTLYNFAITNYGRNARFKPQTSTMSSNYIDEKKVVDFADYNAIYKAAMQSRDRAEDLFESRRDLQNIQWIKKSLNKDALSEKIEQSKRNYINSERTAIQTFLRQVNSFVNKTPELDSEKLKAMGRRLIEMESDLRSTVYYTSGIGDMFTEAKRNIETKLYNNH